MGSLDELLTLPGTRAFERVQQTRTAFLQAYDAHVLGGYDPAVEMRLLLDDPAADDYASISSALYEVVNDEEHVPEESGKSLLLEPEFWSRKHPAIVPYAARKVFLTLFEQHAELVVAEAPDCYRIRCEDYLVRMHRMLAEMIRQASKNVQEPGR